ncbi:MAG: UDP-N-acetylmuramoyl-L-alanyl-D-glutamate--2,6-diaminopimelate ligase [Chthonomonas sp.]|nr:UDP-N-acetylmuramoyl-L-alanyl-D-glutamate--2,6-diaminopimelate ligase [Chthonomonas sp.]
MQLPDLTATTCRPVSPVPDVAVSGICADSRRVQPGDLFVAMPSDRAGEFIAEALRRGAAAAVCNDPALADSGPIFALSPDGFVGQISLLARAVLGDPSAKMRVIGITGTNGKTTCAYLLQQCLTSLGENCAYLGTLGLKIGNKIRELANTTPFPVELWSLLADAQAAGCTHLAMEVSSHALDQERLLGMRFEVGAFTNLSQDHLDYHATLEEYAAAKRRLFTEVGPASNPAFESVLNVDDPVGANWANTLPRVHRVSPRESNPLVVNEVRASSISGSLQGHAFAAPVGGTFNVENLQMVAGILLALGYKSSAVADALSQVRAVPGRFEAVPADGGPEVIVDYAHTPDALEKVLRSARALNPKGVAVVFGCGGDRDRTKRPLMAAVASEWADRVVLTSDNPRTEDPNTILREIAEGIEPGTDAIELIDRPAAIRHAVTAAQVGEIVVIAGKGHEKTQTILNEKIPMDDVELAREALSQWRPQ